MSAERLLIVDDEADVCDFLRDVAEESGFAVETAETFHEFKHAYGSFEPSTIILDLMMPDVDGVEILRFLAGDGCQAHVLLISGLDQKVLHTATRLGATHGLKMAGALQKPLSVAELESAFQRLRGRQRPVTEHELSEGIESGSLLLHYQPKVRVNTNSRWHPDSLEALVRWEHAERGLVSPGEFIPLAERTNLISPLTTYVLHLVLDQITSWRTNGAHLPVAVNLPPQVLNDLDLPDRLTSLLSEHGVDPGDVILEITESAAMTDVSRVMDILTRLRLKGIGLSMDDFGTGYSSLVQLFRMPFTELKIDKSFVIDVDQDTEAQVIVRSTVDLAHNLGLKVCAEGVETEESMELLRAIECDKAQGFLISKPLPPTDLASLLHEWTGAVAAP